MKEINFNVPLHLNNSVKNVHKFLNQKKPLHGPGENILRIKKELKKKFNFKNVYLTNSCTSALEICALNLNLRKNDEVILPSFSFVTTASSFARTGCKLKYCDIERNTLMPSFKQIKKCVNRNTKVIIILHYQGYSVDYLDNLKIFCKRRKIFLIEDAAQAFGSYFKNRPLGSFGDFSCFSFHETKNLNAGAGGMLVVNNKKFIEKSNFIFDKGTNRYLMTKKRIKYYSWVEIGSAFLMSEFVASYLMPQIINYRKILLERSKNYLRYIYNFKNWPNNNFYLVNKYKYKYNFHTFVIILKNDERNRFLKYLKKNKINAVISYTPLHKSKAGKKYKLKKDNLYFTNNLVNKVVRLPLHNYLTFREIDYICLKIRKYFKN